MIEAVSRLWDYIRGRQRAYKLTFSRANPAAMLVLQDLAKFCRATATVYHENERLTHVLIGRNEVFKRIQDHLNLSAEELYELSAGRPLNLTENDQ